MTVREIQLEKLYFIAIFGSLHAIFLTLIIGSYFAKFREKIPGARWVGWIGFFIVFTWMTWVGPSVLSHSIETFETDVIVSTHIIQRAIERYRDKHPEYPDNIKILTDENILRGTRMNPFTRQPMREIEFGDEPYDGEFTYIPVRTEGVVTGYYLICYGSLETEGYDVNGDGVPDHVLKVFVPDNHENHELILSDLMILLEE